MSFWFMLVAGCGGSGGSASGGGAGGSTPAGVSFTLSRTTVTAQGSIDQATGPTETVSITVANPPASGYHVGGRYSKNVITSVAGNYPTGGPLGFDLAFKAPYLLKPGTYTDTVELALCSDAACVHLLTPLQTMSVTYTVAVAGHVPAAALSTVAESFQALLTDYPTTFPQPPPVYITFSNMPVAPTVTVTSSQTGIESVYYSGSSDTAGTFTVYLKTPVDVGPGSYTDTVTVSACLDPACLNPIVPAPTFSVTYTVTNTVGGANGYTINVYPIVATDLVWDAGHNRLLVSLPAATSTDPGSIAVLDPATSQLSSPVLVPGVPGVMGLSADSAYLYVNVTGQSLIQRYVLPALTPDIGIALPNYYPNAVLHAATIEVAPDNPHTVAATLTDDSGNPFGLVVFDDAVARSSTFGYVNVQNPNFISSAIWAATGSVLFGSDGDRMSNPDVYRLAVNASGVQLQQHVTNGPRGRLHFAQNLLYLDTGEILNPATLAVTATFVDPLGQLFMTPDVALNRAFFVNATTPGSSSSGSQLQSFDLATQSPIAAVPLPQQVLLPRRLVRWGSNGLAFIDAYNGKIVVVSGAFVGP